MYLTLNTNYIFLVKMNFILKLLDRVAVLTTTLILQANFFLQMNISNAKMDNVFVKYGD